MRVGGLKEKKGHLSRSVYLVLSLAGIAGVLVLVFGLIPAYSPSEGSASAASVPLELVPRAFLPLLMRSGGTEEPTLTIYDLDGTEQDWEWLTATFGAVTLERGTGSASVRVLRAIEGPVALVARVENADGDPIEGVPVVFYWPNARLLPPEQQACGLDRGDVILTNSNGNAEFIMGGGSYYFPPGGGLHVVWVATEGTDCLGGLGMLGGTNHIHLDSVWRMR
jgi:hypothetical protein